MVLSLRTHVVTNVALAMLLGGCSSESSADDNAPMLPPGVSATATDTGGSDSASSSAPEDASTSVADTSGSSGGADTTTGEPDDCTFCTAPNQACIDDQCVTTCQGQQPDPCGPDAVCDVISGECVDAAAQCALSGSYVACGDQQCGPGSVCDDQGACIPYPPCADVACIDDGSCWGTFCSCERAIECTPPSDDLLNGAFSVEIGDLDFADDCTAWMVTLRSGTDFVRSLDPDGTLTEYAGVSNLNMGEVAVLKALTPPPAIGTTPYYTTQPPPPTLVKGIGEVAITYICCSTCGCFTDPPQGVARLDDDNPDAPLPLVIPAVVTDGTGPFGTASADSGPFGLTWGIDRVLYVGNSDANGDLHTADLEMATQQQITTLDARVTAAAPLTAVHIAVATIGGTIYRFNVETQTLEIIALVDQDVTNMSFDAFSGLLYVSLSNFDVVTVAPFTGEVTPFQVMPGPGRVTVSPNGRLYFSPMYIIDPQPIQSWDIPDSF